MSEWGIDIGHGENTWESGGGKGVKLTGDLGGGRMEEHWFNSAVGIYVKELLEHNGIRVYMAQQPYSNDVGLTTRTNKYNARKVKGVVSIHANAGSRAAHGACAFYWHTAKDSKRMAERWVKHAKNLMSEVGTHGNGLHASVPGTWTNLHICRETHMKAILTENGFMTNPNDIKWLLNDEYRRDCAEAIARMICEEEGVTFKPLPRKGSTAPSKPNPPSLDKADMYTVKKGDTIWAIANRIEGVDVEDIMTLNPGIDPTDLKVGQVINLTKPVGKSAYYTIKKGDTLWSIARDLKTTVKAIQNLNKGLDAHALPIGAKIKIDGSTAVEVKPAPKPKPAPAVDRILKAGMSGDDIRDLQKRLNSLGFNVGKVDGIFGGMTETGLKQFQKAAGIAIDGIYGPNTAKALASYKKPSNPSYVGKRVESKVNGLRFYNRASWSDKYVVGKVNKGIGFPHILSKHKVEDGYQYRVKNSKGQIFYITASETYVVVK